MQLNNSAKVLRTELYEVNTAIAQTKLEVAQQKFDVAKSTVSDLAKKVANLKLGFDELSVIPVENSNSKSLLEIMSPDQMRWNQLTTITRQVNVVSGPQLSCQFDLGFLEVVFLSPQCHAHETD